MIAALALTLVAVPAHAVDARTYSVRACNEHNRGTGNDVRICLKSYFHRQVDGTGWAINSAHIYAWTEGQGMTDCGESWDLPATTDGVVSIDNGTGSDGLSWSDRANLSEGNRCTIFFRGTPLRFVNGTTARIAFTYNAHIVGWSDPDGLEVLRIILNPDGAGFNGSCVANSSCTLDGPY